MLTLTSMQDIRVHGAKHFRSSRKTSLVSRSLGTETMQVVGKGGYGTIYVVRPSSEAPLVKKVTAFDNSKEVLHMKRLQGSKHVVQLVSYHITPSMSEIVMEYCTKGSIEKELKEHGYLMEGRVKEIMCAVFQTLAQCHYQDMIHGDVKPDNFLVSQDNRIVAIDFGNAGCKRHFEHSKGTPHYMAPEQLRYETTVKSDIWSAGVMMYRLLCGEFPFQDRSNPWNPALSAIWKEIFTKEPSFKEYAWNECSSECKSLLTHLLNKDVEQRWTAFEVLQHPWFSSNTTMEIVSLQEKRNIRYQMMPGLLKEMLRYVSSQMHPPMTPEELSSSPNNSLRNQSTVIEHVKEFYERMYPDYMMETSEYIHIQGLLQKEILYPICSQSDVLTLWSKPTLPLYAL
jgi:serine/threonine protein kinase